MSKSVFRPSLYTDVSEFPTWDKLYRSPDWRHRKAFELFDDGKLPSPRLFDAAVCRLTDFYALRSECSAATQLSRLSERMPAVFDAVQIGEVIPAGIRHVTEALVLAGEDASRISDRIGLTEEAVRFFEAAFFDVRSRLHLRDFVMDVIGSPNPDDDHRTHMRRTMKTYCYFAGAQALEIFTLVANDPAEWQRPEQLMSMLARRGEALHQLRLLTDPKSASRSDARIVEMLKAIEEQWKTCWAETEWITNRRSQTKAIIREATRRDCLQLGTYQSVS